VALFAARLSDVDEEGRATRVTYGLLNLTHRDSHEQPEPLQPGRTYTVRITLNGVAQSFPPGHRIRLAVSTSYWPLAWPPPRPIRMRAFPGSSALDLPTRPSDEPDEVPLSECGPPAGATPIRTEEIRPSEQRWRVSRDLVDYHAEREVRKGLGVVRFPDIDLDVTRTVHESYEWIADDFASVTAASTWVVGFRRGDWDARTVTRTTDRKSTRLNSSHVKISYAVFCLKK